MTLPKRTAKSLSNRQEQNIARKLGGRLQPGSGNQWHSKGDVLTDAFLIEAKASYRASISVTAPVWEKIRHEAISKGKTPLMTIQIAGSFANAMDVHDLVVLSLSDFIELLNKIPE